MQVDSSAKCNVKLVNAQFLILSYQKRTDLIENVEYNVKIATYY